MGKRIAVQPNLENVRQALSARGYEVTELRPGQTEACDCAVVTGMQDNLMGIQDTQGRRFPVIEAKGMTAEEVCRAVESRVDARKTILDEK